MIKTFAIGLLTAAALAGASTIAVAADPHGTWMSEDNGTKVRISNCGGRLCGRVVWLRNPIDQATGKPKTDKRNPDASRQQRPLIGLQIISGMQPNGQNLWQGQIYNADDGKIYSASLQMQSDSRARVKGCVFSVLCKAQTWSRAN